MTNTATFEIPTLFKDDKKWFSVTETLFSVFATEILKDASWKFKAVYFKIPISQTWTFLMKIK